jgi:hypothetical protein
MFLKAHARGLGKRSTQQHGNFPTVTKRFSGSAERVGESIELRLIGQL